MGKRRARGEKSDWEWIAEDLRPLAVPIDTVQLDPNNANTHSEASIKAIAASLDRFGQRKPLVLNTQTGCLVAGNGTLLAAKLLGRSLIAVVRVHDDPTSHVGYAIADNRTAELAEWDQVKLAEAISLLDQAMPDFSAELLLADLLDTPAEVPPAAQVPQVYAVQVECADKAAQQVLYKRLKKEHGRKVKCLVL